MKKVLIGLFLFLGVFGFFAVNSFGALDEDLISYYKLDENTGTTAEDSVGSNDGTISGASWTTGKINSGLDFGTTTENRYVNLGTSSSLSTAQMSFSAWVYPTDLDGTQQIISRWDGFSRGYLFGLNDNLPRLQISTTGSDFPVVDSSVTISNNQWSHIVGTYDGANIKIYVNGVLRGTTAVTGNINFVNVQTRIGTRADDINIYAGEIDEVGIWSRTLTSEEITELYNSGDGLQYPFQFEEIIIDNISVNDNTFVNNSYFETNDLNFSLNLNNVSTNANINTTLRLYNEDEFLIHEESVLNTLNPEFELLDLTNGVYTIDWFSQNNETNTTSGLYTFEVFYLEPIINISDLQYIRTDIIDDLSISNNEVINHNEISFWLKHFSNCKVIINNNLAGDFNAIIGKTKDYTLKEGYNSFIVYCEVWDEPNRILYFDSERVTFFKQTIPSTATTFKIIGKDFDISKQDLYITSPCLRSGTYIGYLNDPQFMPYRSEVNPEGAYFKRVDKNGIATLDLPLGTHSICLFSGKVNYPTFQKTNDYTIVTYNGNVRIGEITNPNTISKYYEVQVGVMDIYDNTRPEAWGTSWSAIILSIIGFFMGIMVILLGSLLKSSAVIITGGFMIFSSIGLSLITIAVRFI